MTKALDTKTPIDPSTILASFDDLWAPRIVTRVNDYDVRVAKIAGEFVWHTHDNTDEFFLVLQGKIDIALRDDGGERTVSLGTGSIFVVPRGMEHKPSSTDGASILLFEPTGTPNTGDRHDELPAHINTTTGQPID